MTDPKKIMFDTGKADALNLAARAPDLDGTAIIAEEEKIPAWSDKADYSGKAVGIPVADEGQVWLLLIPHRAADYVGRPGPHQGPGQGQTVGGFLRPERLVLPGRVLHVAPS